MLRPLPLVLLLAILVMATRWITGRETTDRALPRLSLTVFALALLLKIVLNVRAFHYGFALAMPATLVLVVSLALGTPVLSLIGSIGAALTLGLRGGGVLTSLLVLPLYIPVLIFGAGAVGAAASGLDVTAYFLLLGAFALFAIVLTPWAVAIALRISVE
jgi:heme exporter protein B